MFWHRKRTITWASMNGADLVSQEFRALTRWQEYHQSRYTAILGWNQDNQDPVFLNLEKAPHALIAGCTGSGKSVGINTLLASLLVKNTPVSLELYIIDPKWIDYAKYKGLPHLKGYATGIRDATGILNHVKDEMMSRYRDMEHKGLENTDKGHILVVCDEFASLMGKEGKKALLPSLQEIARLGRAAGVHLVLGIQRPTRDVLDGQLKANCPTRIAYRVASVTDSRVILDAKGAEQLRGNGDGLYLRSDGRTAHFQGHMTATEQLEQILAFWKDQAGQNNVRVAV